jgi:hypothetical protein
MLEHFDFKVIIDTDIDTNKGFANAAGHKQALRE